MNVSHYIGFDVHKKHINFCIKTGEGAVVEQGPLAAQRSTLRAWAAGQTQAWHGAMEATLFSGWIYDTLKPYATCLEMAHPLMLKAIVASKKRYVYGVKIHLMVTAQGQPVECLLTPGSY